MRKCAHRPLINEGLVVGVPSDSNPSGISHAQRGLSLTSDSIFEVSLGILRSGASVEDMSLVRGLVDSPGANQSFNFAKTDPRRGRDTGFDLG